MMGRLNRDRGQLFYSFCLQLTDAAFRDLAAAATFADPDGIGFAGHHTIAQKRSMWRQTGQKHLRKAVQLSYLTARRRKRPNGGYSSNE